MVDSLDQGGRETVLAVSDLHVTLTRRLETNRVLRGVDLNIAAGQIVALVGESGSGKSTLGLSIGGLLPPQAVASISGSVRIAGTEAIGASEDVLRQIRRDQVRYIFQNPLGSLNPTKRIGPQLREAGSREADPQLWLERVGIRDAGRRLRSFPHELSGGQRQRVMIAMAMLNRPALVVADEPTTALDVTVQRQVLDLMRDLAAETGTAFLFITHDLAVASELADEAVVLYGGRICEQGPIKAMLAEPRHPYTKVLLSARFGIDHDRSRPLQVPDNDPGIDLPDTGCLFAPRCIYAVDQCSTEAPPIVPVGHGGTTACWRHDTLTEEQHLDSSEWSPAVVHGDNAPLVTVTGARRTYAARRNRATVTALDGVSLSIRPGEAVAVVGESGSGKTTLLRAIAGLETLDEGTVTQLRRPQMIFQDPSASLTPWLRVEEIIAERLRAEEPSKTDRRQRVIETLGLVGLRPFIADRKPRQLSGGQQQRVAIARALIVAPQLLLADEPISSVDVSLAASILNLLVDLRRTLGFALLFVTHDIAAARFVADRIIVMHNGSIVEDGDADRVVHAPEHDYTRTLLDSMPGSLSS